MKKRFLFKHLALTRKNLLLNNATELKEQAGLCFLIKFLLLLSLSLSFSLTLQENLHRYVKEKKKRIIIIVTRRKKKE